MLTHLVTRDIAQPAFWGGFANYPTFMDRLARRRNSNNLDELYSGFGYAPSVREMKGGRSKVAVPTYDFTLTNRMWENTVPIDYPTRRFDRANRVSDLLADMGRKARAFPEKLGSTILNTNPLGYDGVALFSTAHVDASADFSTAQDNALTTNIANPLVPTDIEFAAAVRSMMNAIFGYVDGAGDPYWPGDGSTFYAMVPTMYMGVARQVANNDVLTGNVSNDMKGTFTPIVNPHLTVPVAGHGYFYLANGSAPQAPLVYQVVDEVRLEDDMGGDNEFDTKDVHFGTFAMYNVGPGNWRTIVREDFT